MNRRWSRLLCQHTPTPSAGARKLVSIGGWCGPALILGKLGLRTEAYPFDFSRCTLDGICHFIENGFDQGFFPPGNPPFKPECVGIWVLFRGQHTAFAHFDLNDPRIHEAFRRKIHRWNSLLDGKDPVTFFRTVTAKNPEEELSLIPTFEECLRRRNPNLDFRTVVTVHDQQLGPTTQRLQPLTDRSSLWALEYSEDESKTLFDRSQQGYAEIVAHSLDEDNWPANQCPGAAPRPSQWREHNNLALIDGIASVGGTCIGIGSTKCKDMTCPFCGNTDFHKAGRPARTDRPFTDEEDELLLLHLYKILTGGDKVEAIEQLAHEMNRGAFEVICRIQFLTNSSTKIAEGIDTSDSN